MRRKLNESLLPVPPGGGDSIYYRYFRYYFDFYLPVRPDLPQPADRRRLYVRNPVVEAELDRFLQAEQSFCQLLVGFTGIGKSTILSNFFGYVQTTPIVLDNRIIVPYSCNSLTSKSLPSQFFAESIRIVTDLLTRRSGGALDMADLHAYVSAQRPHALTRYRKFMFVSAEDDLRILAENDEFAYQAMLLKYLLRRHENNKISQVILVFDDVEALDPPERRREFIEFAYHAFCCLRKHDRGWHTKLLIAERPYTKADFNRLDWQEQRPDMAISAAASLKDLFHSRHEFAISTLAPEAVQRESWTSAYKFLCSLVDHLAYHNGDFLVALDNYNIRHALNTLESMLAHGNWFQARDDDAKPGSFRIDGKPVLTKVNVRRILASIAYGSRTVYREALPRDYGLPNILRNQKMGGVASDIAPFLVLRWFAKDYDAANIGNPGNLRQIKTLENIILSLFPQVPDLSEAIRAAFKHFVDRGILEKFMDSEDRTNTDWLYLMMPRGNLLWELLTIDTSLFELYRDDLWCEEGIFTESYTRSTHHLELLIDCLRYCEHIASCEEQLVRSLISVASREQYSYAFGKQTAAERLMSGVMGSARKLYDARELPRPPRLHAAWNSAQKRILHLEKLINE